MAVDRDLMKLTNSQWDASQHSTREIMEIMSEAYNRCFTLDGTWSNIMNTTDRAIVSAKLTQWIADITDPNA